MRARRWFAAALAAVAIPALAQNLAQVQPAPPPAAPPPQLPQSSVAAPAARPATAPPVGVPAAGEAIESQTGVVDADALSEEELEPPPPPVEIPDFARRDPRIVGTLDPAELGLTARPWERASGAFLSTLMRRMDAPIASRWIHIGLRNLLLARTPAPRNVNPVDWTAERAWLLLRMGEADAARLLVSGVDVDRFTPKMFQVSVQSALANADPSALCPLQEGIAGLERKILPLVDAMCAALAGEPEAAAAQIDAARRRGRISGIDLVLAQKVVGAGSDTGRAVTVEWEPVQRLNSWRFGLATATGMTFPERLIDDAPVQLRAWQAQAPLIAPQDRLDSAKIATGLGVFSSQALIDLYSLIYDRLGPDELPESDAWQLRTAFVGKDRAERLSAMRAFWGEADGRLEEQAVRVLLGRAATLIRPDPALQADAANLIASMLAAGYGRDAAQWADAVGQMDDQYADRGWAMLALGAPDASVLDLSNGRINGFIRRDDSPGRKRSALLIAGLAGLGRLDAETAGRLSARYGLGLDRRSLWTRIVDRAAGLGQPGTVLLLTGTGLQTERFEDVPAAHLYHAVSALNRTGQDFTARMLAAEALART